MYVCKYNQNKVHPSIKFHFNYSSSSNVNFLDTTVKKSKIFDEKTLHHVIYKGKRLLSLSSQKMRTPGVFKTQYSISLSPTCKMNMHQRLRFQSQL